MARKPRIESSDGLYHVLNRGNYRSYIFKNEGAKEAFEKTLFEACARNSWELLAYCLLSNHFHLCLATPQGNLSEGMRWLQATYAIRSNRFRRKRGHLFQGRFKSLIVEPGDYLSELVDYIHLNPLRAGLMDSAKLAKYRWSSLYHFPKRKTRPEFLKASWMDDREDMEDSRGGWLKYRHYLRSRAETDPSTLKKLEKQMNRGWCVGSKKFKQKVAKKYLLKDGIITMQQKELQEFNLLQWEHILNKALQVLGKSKADLAKTKLSEAWKLAIASCMKRHTSVSNQWLSEHLIMGTPNGVSSNCGKYHREREKRCKYAKKLNNFIFEH